MRLYHCCVSVPRAATLVICTKGIRTPRGCGCSRSQNRTHSLCKRASPSAIRACRSGPGSAAPHWAQTSTSAVGGGRPPFVGSLGGVAVLWCGSRGNKGDACSGSEDLVFLSLFLLYPLRRSHNTTTVP